MVGNDEHTVVRNEREKDAGGDSTAQEKTGIHRGVDVHHLIVPDIRNRCRRPLYEWRNLSDLRDFALTGTSGIFGGRICDLVHESFRVTFVIAPRAMDHPFLTRWRRVAWALARDPHRPANEGCHHGLKPMLL